MNHKEFTKKILLKDGYSFVELMVALSIAGMIIGTTLTFLITSTNSYRTASDISELQTQSQIAVNYITQQLLNYENIKSIDDIPRASLTLTGERAVTKIVVEKDSGSELFAIRKVTDSDLNCDKIQVSEFYPPNFPSYNDLAFYVDDFKIEPILENGTTIVGLEYYINFNKGNASLPVTNMVYFRN